MKIIFFSGLELRLFGEIVGEILLERTPHPVIYAVVLLTGACAAYAGIEARARMAEIILAIMVLPVVILAMIALLNSNFPNLQPILITPPETFVFAMMRPEFVNYFTGLEFIWLAFPFLDNPRNGPKAAVYVTAAVGVFMAVTVALTLATFGPDNVLVQDWPVLKMMDMIAIPGVLIERQEALVLSIWMLSVFMFSAASLFYGAVLGQGIVKKGKHLAWVIGCAAAVFCVAVFPFERDRVFYLMDRVSMVSGLSFLFGLPILLMVAAKLRGVKQRKGDSLELR